MLAAAALLVSGPAAAAQQDPPTAEELWEAYPLETPAGGDAGQQAAEPTPEPTPEPTAEATPEPRAEPAPAATPRRQRAAVDDGGIPVALIVLVALAAVAAAAMFLVLPRLGRRRSGEGADAGAPAPAPPPAPASAAQPGAVPARRAAVAEVREAPVARADADPDRPVERPAPRPADAPGDAAAVPARRAPRARPGRSPARAPAARLRGTTGAADGGPADAGRGEGGAARVPPRSGEDERLWPGAPRDAARRPRQGRPPDPARDWVAETHWRQAEGPARFEIVAAAGDERVVIANSGPVVWPPSGPDDIQRLNQEISRLEEGLLAAGWTALPAGDAWYAKRFAWAGRAPAEPGSARSLRAPTRQESRFGGPAAKGRAARQAPPGARPAGARGPEAPGAGRFPAREAPAPDGEDAETARFARRKPWPEGADASWRCEIKWEAGYKTSRFAAMARAPGARRPTRMGESQTFKWMLMDTPDMSSPLFRPVVRSMVTALEEAGWERIEPGAEWWEQRFVWRREGQPPERVEPAPVDVEA